MSDDLKDYLIDSFVMEKRHKFGSYAGFSFVILKNIYRKMTFKKVGNFTYKMLY